MSGPEERERAVDLYFTMPMTAAQVVGASGLSDQAVLGTSAGGGSPVCRPYGQAHHPPWKRGPRAVGLVPGGMQRKQAARELGVGIGTVRNRAGACRRGGMAALQAGNRDAAQNGRPASAPRRNRNAGDGNDDTEALRRRVEDRSRGNAVMREVVEVAGKDPGAGLRRLSDRGAC